MPSFLLLFLFFSHGIKPLQITAFTGLNHVRHLIQGQDNPNQNTCFAGASSTFADSEILKCLLSASIARALCLCQEWAFIRGAHNCQQPAGHLGSTAASPAT